jgi:hypothetical protein
VHGRVLKKKVAWPIFFCQLQSCFQAKFVTKFALSHCLLANFSMLILDVLYFQYRNNAALVRHARRFSLRAAMKCRDVLSTQIIEGGKQDRRGGGKVGGSR